MADASGHEPVWAGGRRVGFVVPGTEFPVHVVGVERPARVIAPAPYDPTGQVMRS